MDGRQLARFAVVFVLALVGVGSLWSTLFAERATTQSLGGPERFLTHLSTDKPIYRPGERLYVRGVLLSAADHTPLKANEQAQAFIQVKGPKGDVVASGQAGTQDSVLGFAWDIPAGQPGGEYTLRVGYPWSGFAPAERKFDIRAFRAPRLRSQIVFLRDGYGPGDTVGATLHTERAEGGIPEGAKVTVIARVDGAEVFKGPSQIDSRGNCTVAFKLPPEIARGEGTLALVIEDGGVIETATKTIPILLQTVDLNLYPESGDLVATLPNRVYIEARTPAKKPADISGIVVDEQGAGVAFFRTEHEGRGRFTFTPRAGAKYTLKITEPSGIKTAYPLPAVKESGAVIRAVEDRTGRSEAVRLRVGSTSGGRLTVTLAKREIEVSSVSWDATPGLLAEITLTPPSTADGVLVATVWDAKGNPLAERLIYRQPSSSLHLSIASRKTSYVPGDKVELTVRATDDQGRPVGAVVGLTVTDDSVLEMIEKREQAARLPVMVLLEDDVKELADAHVYLDEANPKAPLAVDLILGTQGWRRFAFVDPVKFVAANGDPARRVLALRLPTPPRGTVYRGAVGGGREGGARLDLGLEAEADAQAPLDDNWDGPGQGHGRPQVKLAEAKAEAAPAPPAKAPAAVAAEMPRPEAKAAPAQPAAGPVAMEPGKPRAMKEALEQAQGREAQADLLVAEDREMPAGQLRAAARRPRLVRQSNFAPVRVYAHDVRPNRQPADRVDFAETLYWNAGVRTDDKSGEATVTFALSDAVTAFRVFADAFSSAGALGAAASTVESVQPFYIEPKLPLEVTAGDVIELPVSVVNAIESGLADASLTVTTSAELQVAAPKAFLLPPKSRERRIVQVKVGHLNGPTDFVLQAKSGPYVDKVTRKLTVKPLGFPVEIGVGGVLNPNGGISQTVVIPPGVVPRSVTTKIAVYPTPLANLTQALERLIQEPNGCFEQTSSTAYPLVMAQQYFMSHTGVEPALIQRSRDNLDRGYQKLASFECKQRGYEWFGGDPGHEALTAYGLLEFTDMAQVREVDPKMIERTRQWLLARRDGKGAFQFNSRALDSFGRAPQDTATAYCVWALLEARNVVQASGLQASGTLAPLLNLEKEIAAVKQTAQTTKDSYIVALAANVLALSKDADGAKALMERLVKSQTKDGSVDGAVTSITCSGGDALKIEATALATLAWLRDPAYAGAVEQGLHFLAESCKGGRYGSTQSTVLALRAIVAYDKARAKPRAPGRARIFVDGQAVGGPVAFDEKTQGAIALPDISELLDPGKHTVEVKMEDGSPMPVSMAINYNATQPASSDQCKVGLQVKLNDKEIAEGGITEAQVTVTVRSKQAVPMPVAIIGLPGGLEPRHDQLKELVKAGKIDAYEVIGREVVLYWRALRPEQQVEVPLSLVAAVPGTYTGPASRAYQYYTDEFKCWVDPLRVVIVPKAQ